MKLHKPQVKKLIESKNYSGLEELLSTNPSLSNEGITIPYDNFCSTKAHPLHRICDAVFVRKITDEEAVKLAKIFIENGANIDGDKHKGEGTPLLAAASLHAEQVGIFYIQNGGDIDYTFKNDGVSALHWAAFCGKDKLVRELIQANAAIDEPDKEHKSTPLGWAVHALMMNDKQNRNNQLSCIKLLLNAGSKIENLDHAKINYINTLSDSDSELQNLCALNNNQNK